MTLTIALFEPRIPQNTGNIARTCAAFNIPLILIKPLGFSLDDRYLKRAGLDYWKYVNVSTFENFDEFKNGLSFNSRIIGCSSYGGEKITDINFQSNDVLLFGREDNGLPDHIRSQSSFIATIPMPNKANSKGMDGVRSLNLSVSVAIVTFVAGNKINLW